MDEEVQVHVPSSTERTESSRRGTFWERGVVVVNEEKGVFGSRDLMIAPAVYLSKGALGTAFKANLGNGLSIMVKKMGVMKEIGRDSFDTEMRGFGRIKHANILPVLAYYHFLSKHDKLIISEYMPKGSLLYVLHGDKGTFNADLTWPVRLKIIKGIAQGLSFLHSHFSSYDLPHGNLKSSNVLLTQDYEPLLSDYALHPLLNPNSFPSLFAFKSPDYVEYQFISQKSDIYCLGIIILEIITGKFPSQYHSNNKGGTDVVQWVLAAISERREAQVIDPEIANTPNSLDHMLQILQVGAACTESNPVQRINLSEAIRRIEEVAEINDNDGSVKFTCLGSNLADNEKPQYTVPPNVWFGSFPTKDFDILADGSVQTTPPRDGESHYSLVGCCTCAPAFQFQDFKLRKRSDLISQFPHLESLINTLTYPDS